MALLCNQSGRVWACALALSAGSTSASAALVALPVTYIDCAKTVNNTGADKKAFRVVLTSTANLTVNTGNGVDILDPPANSGNTREQGSMGTTNGTKEVTVTWDVPTRAGKEINYSVRGNGGMNVKIKERVFFDPPPPNRALGATPTETDVPGLGWRYDDATGDVFLLNGSPFDVNFAGLGFFFPATMPGIDDSLAFIDNLGGAPGSVSDGMVDAAVGDVAGELFVGNFPLASGSIIGVRLDASFPSGGGSMLAAGQFMAYANVPGPGAACMGLLAGCVLARRRR